MNKTFLYACAFLCLSSIPAAACECLEYPDVKLMLRSSDFAYVGEWVAADYPPAVPAEAPVNFKISQVLMGSPKALNATIALDRKKDVVAECRAFTGAPLGKFIVFGSMYDNQKETFLTDCATDIVSVTPAGKLGMRGQEIAVDLKQLQEEPRAVRASEMSEEDAIKFATAFAAKEKKYEKIKYSVLNTQYKDMGGFKPYWVVRFAEYPPVTDGLSFKVKLYTSEKEGMALEEGE